MDAAFWRQEVPSTQYLVRLGGSTVTCYKYCCYEYYRWQHVSESSESWMRVVGMRVY